MIEPVEIQFEEGDPYRSTDLNRVVRASVDIAAEWPVEHGPAGTHDSPRFEQAGIYINLVTYETRGSGIAYWAEVGRVVEITLEEPFASAEDWGVIAHGWQGAILPEVVDEKSTSKTKVLVPSGEVHVHIVVVGRRMRA